MSRIISASRRTDIPAWYGRWFLERLQKGKACYGTPFSSRIHEVSLLPDDVTAFVFWTRNVLPFLPAVDRLEQEGYPFYFQYTFTGYGPPWEPKGHGEKGLEGLIRLAERIGPDRVVWRYDPIVLSPEEDADTHRKRFGEIADRLRRRVNTVTVSFLDRYRKTERRLRSAGLTVRDPGVEEGRKLLIDLAGIAGERGITLDVCCEEELRPPGIPAAACVDPERIRRLTGDGKTSLPRRPTRPGCRCAESRDIGAYDTCPFGCVYCYAVSSPDKAEKSLRDHRPEEDRLRPA